MLKVFTKQDRRTNLEREIDEVLEVLRDMKAELDNSPSRNLDDEINEVLDDMTHVSPESDPYMNMVKALDILYKAKASTKSRLEEYSEMVKNYKALCEERDKKKERRKEIIKIGIAGTIQIVGLVIVLKHEDLNVITSKAFSHVPWVKL